MKDFIIEYSLFKDNQVIKSGKIKVKNVDGYDLEFASKLKLDKYLSKTIVYDKMVVHSCKEDILSSMGIFGNTFKDIFNGKY